ncbi:hypothetical protein NESM_000038300 [Novymonas esmeraldas]|uniref:Uncharacterized protein n=1 Tax=Novymonas esmeraldas TaxID=1808958 RepID=A0AAW0F3U2_9TRYP
MAHRGGRPRPYRSPAAAYAPPSSSSTASTPAPTPTPAISAVCVDVRELLRHANAAPKSALSDARTPSSRQPDAPKTAADAVVSSSSSRSPRPSLTSAAAPPPESAFWAPAYPPLSGFTANSGPPPLSPTDATILNSILGQPSVLTTTLTDYSYTSGLADGAPTQLPQTRRPSLRSSAVASPSPPPLAAAAAAASHPLAVSARDSSGDGVSGRTTSAQSGMRTPRADTATPYQASFVAELTSAPTPLPGVLVGYSETGRAHHAVAGGTMVDAVDLSPTAHRAMTSVLGQLHTYAGTFASAEGQGAPERDASVYSGGRGASPLPPHRAPAYTSAAGVSPPPRPRGLSACAGRGGSAGDGAVARRSVAQLWRQCPALAAATFNTVDMEPHRPQGAVQAAAATSHGLAYDKPHAAATVLSPVAHRRSSPAPRRTIPPAFQRQLRYSEAAPTTRRPKRK